ncbi:hypothetical protein [Cloacibacillus evryensis]|uniref:hypothetical protein n=1 Tax=Cloacibacillus evryensis TaxID=508460 RepID=UPI00241D8361|nr:hypothetical protein [Cloacibacillus evryensis]
MIQNRENNIFRKFFNYIYELYTVLKNAKVFNTTVGAVGAFWTYFFYNIVYPAMDSFWLDPFIKKHNVSIFAFFVKYVTPFVIFCLVLVIFMFIRWVFLENKHLKKEVSMLRDLNTKNSNNINLLTNLINDYKDKLKKSTQLLEVTQFSFPQKGSKMTNTLEMTLICPYPPRINTMISLHYKKRNDDFYNLLSTAKVTQIEGNKVCIQLVIIPEDFKFTTKHEYRFYTAITEKELSEDLEKIRNRQKKLREDVCND